MEDDNPLNLKYSTNSINEGWFCPFCNKNNFYNNIKCDNCGKKRNYLKKNDYTPNSIINIDYNDIPVCTSIKVNENLSNSYLKNSLEMSGMKKENDVQETWKCTKCQMEDNNGNFCPNCGIKKPE